MKSNAHKMGPDSPCRESPIMAGYPGMNYGSSSAAGSAHGLQVPGTTVHPFTNSEFDFFKI